MLEIKVNDICHVCDTADEAVDFVAAEIRRWFVSQDQAPLTITLSKIESRAGPALSISVGDKLPTKEALG